MRLILSKCSPNREMVPVFMKPLSALRLIEARNDAVRAKSKPLMHESFPRHNMLINASRTRLSRWLGTSEQAVRKNAKEAENAS